MDYTKQQTTTDGTADNSLAAVVGNNAIDSMENMNQQESQRVVDGVLDELAALAEMPLTSAELEAELDIAADFHFETGPDEPLFNSQLDTEPVSNDESENENEMASSPIAKPTITSPISTRAGDSPFATPSEGSRASTPTEGSPIPKPIITSPILLPIGDSPFATPSGGSPVSTLTEVSPIAKPIITSPIARLMTDPSESFKEPGDNIHSSAPLESDNMAGPSDGFYNVKELSIEMNSDGEVVNYIVVVREHLADVDDDEDKLVIDETDDADGKLVVANGQEGDAAPEHPNAAEKAANEEPAASKESTKKEKSAAKKEKAADAAAAAAAGGLCDDKEKPTTSKKAKSDAGGEDAEKPLSTRVSSRKRKMEDTHELAKEAPVEKKLRLDKCEETEKEEPKVSSKGRRSQGVRKNIYK